MRIQGLCSRWLIVAVSLATSVVVLRYCLVNENRGGVPDVSLLLSEQNILRKYAGREVPFVENVGQIRDENIRYSANLNQGMAFVSDTALVFSLAANIKSAKEPERVATYQAAMSRRDEGREGRKISVFSLNYKNNLGEKIVFKPRGQEASAVAVSRFTGREEEKWQKQIGAFNKIALGELWTGIRVELRAYGENVEQVYRVGGNGSPIDIRMSFDGLENLEVDESGKLTLVHEGGVYSLTAPIAYQYDDQRSTSDVMVKYRVNSDKSVGFEVSAYDASRELIIDPLLAATYVGGSGEERFAYDSFGGHIYAGQQGVVRDSSENIYVIGTTRSSNYPTRPGVYDTSYNDGVSYLPNDLVVSKFDKYLEQLLSSTYIGGNSEDNASTIALDGAGNIYVAGFTRSLDFPVVNGNHDTSYNGGPGDSFIVKLSGDLSQLLGGTYLGGRGTESIYAMIFGEGSTLYVAGDTDSDNFPVRVGGYQTSALGSSDGFIVKLDQGLTTVSSGTYLGGSGEDYSRALALTSSGKVVVVSNTSSGNFPTTVGAYDTTPNGRFDVAISRLTSDLTTLEAGTVIGHTYDDLGFSVKLLSGDELLIGGMTESPSFPTTSGAYDRTHNGVYDIFVSKFASDLHSLNASTFVGGNNWDDFYGMGVDSSNQIFVAGNTRSADYPTTNEAYQRSLSGTSDGFISQFSANISSLSASTYLGGSGNLDAVLSFVFDEAQNVIGTGVSNSANFPIVPGGYQTTSGGLRDMVLFKMTNNLLADLSSSYLTVRDGSGNSSLTMAAGGTTSVKVTVHDQSGNVLQSYHGNYSVKLSGAAISPTGVMPTCNGVNFGTSMTLNFNRGVATCTLRLYAAEDAHVEAWISNSLRSQDDESRDLDVTVTPGAINSGASLISINPAPTVVGFITTIRVDVTDGYGNLLQTLGEGKTVDVIVSGTNPRTGTATDIGGGVYTWTYTPSYAGYDAIVANVDSAPVGRDSDGTSNGTYNLTVLDAGLDHLEVRYKNVLNQYVSSGTLQAGQSYTLYIFAKDALGNNVMTYDGGKRIYLTGPNAAPDGSLPTCDGVNFGSLMSLSFTDGLATCTFIPKKVESAAIDVREEAIIEVNSYANPSHDLDVAVYEASVSYLTITGPQNWVAGTPQSVTLYGKDTYGNVHSAYTGVRQITFSGPVTSRNGTKPQAQDKNGLWVDLGSATSIMFNAGVATTTLRLATREAKSIDITDTVSNSDGSASYDLDVVVESTGVAVGTESEITSSFNPTGLCGAIGIVVTTRDAYGNQLEAGGNTVVMSVAGANTDTPSVTDRADGTYFGNYTPSNSGNDQLTATVNGQVVWKDLDGVYDGIYNQVINADGVNTATWTGGVSSAWQTAANWSGGQVPTPCHNVVIDGGYTYLPILDHGVLGLVNIQNLTVGSTQTSVFQLDKGNDTYYLRVLGNVTVGPYGNVTSGQNTTSLLHSLRLQVEGNATVSVGGKFDVSGKGYYSSNNGSYSFNSGVGPGAGATSNSSGVGGAGTHVGVGGKMGSSSANLTTYGSIVSPATIGSSGGYFCNSNPSCSSGGGGSLRLVVGGILTIDGSVRGDGGPGLGYYAGGGAGGGVWIDTHELKGAGTISANGGAGGGGGGGPGGGGGRLAVYYDILSYTGGATATGGVPTNGTKGGAGTVYWKDRAAQYGELLVDNSGVAGETTRGLSGYNHEYSKFTVRNGASYVVVSGERVALIGVDTWNNNGGLTVDGGGVLEAASLTTIQGLTVTNNGTYRHSGPTLRLGSGVTWNENGAIVNSANGLPITDIVLDSAIMEFRNQLPSVPKTYNSITINSGSTLRHGQNTTSLAYSLNLQVKNLTINSGGKIDVSSKGYYSSNGVAVGAGAGSGNGGYIQSGAAHGGSGGAYGAYTSLNTYGSISQPEALGSTGGAGANGTLGISAGGGVSKLVVEQMLTVNGSILADGVTIAGTGGGHSTAGGAGGSLWIDADELAGNGNITVNGSSGVANTQGAGGGAGGRVAIYYNLLTYTGSVSAYGGAGAQGGTRGGAGTIYWKDKANSYGRLIIDNNGSAGESTRGINGYNLEYSDIQIRNGGIYQVVSGERLALMGVSSWNNNGALIINSGGIFEASSLTTIQGLTITNNGTYRHSGYTLTLGTGVTWNENGSVVHFASGLPITDIVLNSAVMEFRNQLPSVPKTYNSITINSSSTLRHGQNTTSLAYSLNLQVKNLTINSGGKIDVSSRGYYSSNGVAVGAGAGSGNGGYIQSGAAHGGSGGAYGAYTSLNTYGSISQPEALGSTGGAGSNGTLGTSAGGGVSKLVVEQLLTVNGSILADGATVSGTGGGYSAAGGAGGSIWLDAGELAGNGSISANGSAGFANTPAAGGGAGGRVAIYYNLLTYGGNLSAYGGAGAQGGTRGGAGTIYWKNKVSGDSSLVLNNNNQAGEGTLFVAGVTETHPIIKVLNSAVLQLRPGRDSVTTPLYEISNTGVLELNSYTTATRATLQDVHILNGGVMRHSDNSTAQTHVAAVKLNNLTIDSGGLIDLNGLGFDPGNGSGASATNSRGGAGYGGSGGTGNTGAGGTNYGVLTLPNAIGSGAYSGASGGGLLLLRVANTLSISGTIRANGAGASNNWGGGSGGGMLITANNLIGSGYIQANGGAATGNGGGGAGGRIAVYYFDQTFLMDGGHITSATPGAYTNPVGGTGYNAGGNGSLYFAHPDHYQLTGSGTQTAGSTQTLTVTLIDNFGNPFIWDGTRDVVLSSNTASADDYPATCTDLYGNAVPLNRHMSLSFVSGVATCNLTLAVVGTHEIDADDGIYNSSGNTSYDLDVTVTAGASGSAIYSSLSANKKVATVGEVITASLAVYDAYGNPRTSGGETVVIVVSGANNATPSVSYSGGGVYTANYTATNSGEDLIRATLNGITVLSDTDGIPDGVFHVSVIGAPANHLEVKGVGTQHTGYPQTITIQATIVTGIVDGGYEGIKNLTLSGANVSPTGRAPTCRDRFGVDQALGNSMQLEFIGGRATCQLYLYKVETAEIEASDGTLSSTGNASWDLDVVVSINGGTIPQGSISASPSIAVENDVVQATVQITDYFGNSWALTGQTVSIGVSANNVVTPLVSDQGGGQYRGNYSAVNVGTDEIRATVNGVAAVFDADGVSDGVYHLPVNVVVPAEHLEVSGAGVQTAGESQSITIAAKSNAGLTAPSYRGTKTITLSGGLTSLKGQVATCLDKNGAAIALGSAMALDFTNGVATCDLVLYRAGAQSIDASDGSLDSTGNDTWDLDVTVSAAVVHNASAYLSGSGTSVNTKDTVTAVVYGRDQYGNNVSSGGTSVGVNVAGTNAQALSITDNLDGTYTGSYEARNAGLDEIRGAFNGVNITSDNDGVSDGIYHLTVNDTVTATHLEVKGANSQIAGSFQPIVIQALDDGGYRDFGYAGTKAVKMSGANVTKSNNKPACLDRQGMVKSFGTLTNLDFVNGQATCQMVLYKVEAAHIDAESGSLNSYGDEAYDLDVDVLSAGTGVASALIDALPNPVLLNGTVGVTITTLDEYGNQTYDLASVLSSTVAGANPQVLTLSDEGDGRYTASYAATASGIDNITGTLNSGVITADSDGLSNGTYVLRVVSEGFADHLEISGDGTQDVGSSQMITIRAKMLGGATDTSYSGIHGLTLSGASASPTGNVPTCRDRSGVDRAFGTSAELNFLEGVATCRMYLYKAGLAEIDATDGVLSTVGDVAWDLEVTATVNPGGVPQGRISGTVTTAIENEVVGLQVQAVDVYGNDWTKTGLTVVLNVTGANTVMPTVTDNLDGTYLASYTASGVGTDQVRGTVNAAAILYDTDGTSDGVYNITVLAGILPHHFELTGVNTQVAGTIQEVTITARAQTGEVAPSYRGDKSITLSGGLISLKGQHPTCTDKTGAAIGMGNATTVVFNNGVGKCQMVLYRRGEQSLDATDGSLTSAGDATFDLDVTVSAAALSAANSLVVGSDRNIDTKEREEVIVYTRDAFWNGTGDDAEYAGDSTIAKDPSVVAITLTGANAQVLVVTDNGDGTYSGSYVARVPGTDYIRASVNGVNTVLDSDGTSDGVYTVTVRDTITANHLVVTGSSTQSSGSFQTIALTATDAEGYRDFGYEGLKTVKLSGAARTQTGFKPACIDKTGVAKPFGASTVLEFVAGQTSCQMVLYKVEQAHIDADDGQLNSFGHADWDLDVNVLSLGVDDSGGALAVTPNPVGVGGTVSVLLTLTDMFGVPAYDGAKVVSLYVSGANFQTLSVIDHKDGTYTASYIAENHGLDLIEATVDGEPIIADSDGTSDGVFHLTVVPLDGEIDVTPRLAEKGETVTVKVTLDMSDAASVEEYGWDVTVNVLGANPRTVTAVDNLDRTYTISYVATKTGVDFIRASVAGAVVSQDTDGVSDGVYQLPVVGDRDGGGVAGNLISGFARYQGSGLKPASGVQVTDGVRSTDTDEYGFYVLAGVANGTYTVRGYKDGYQVQGIDHESPILINNNSATNVNLLLSTEMPVQLYAPWNGFLGNVVIVEIFNTGSQDLNVLLKLFKMEGSKAGAEAGRLRYSVPVGEQRDVIVNDMPGFQVDRYGVLKVEMSSTNYNGQVSYYKVSPEGSGFRKEPVVWDDFDYAFDNPFMQPMTGTSYVGFNTMQPSTESEEKDYLVPNWLTIINGESDQARYFRIRKYTPLGKRYSIPDNLGSITSLCAAQADELRCKVPAMGRVDIDGGHVYPGPGNIGTIEIVPEDEDGKYVADLVRYGMASPPTVYTNSYKFATHLQARAGTSTEQVLPISAMSGVDNWIEVINVLGEPVNATLDFYTYEGELLGGELVKVPARGQVHIGTRGALADGYLGIARISASKANSLVVSSMTYYRAETGRIYGVMGNQAEGVTGTIQYGTYNRFLGMYNWLKLVNLTTEERVVTVVIHRDGKEDQHRVRLKARGGVDLGLHDEARFGIGVNKLGMLQVQDSVPGGVFAQVVRVKPLDNGGLDFLMATKVR